MCLLCLSVRSMSALSSLDVFRDFWMFVKTTRFEMMEQYCDIGYRCGTYCLLPEYLT